MNQAALAATAQALLADDKGLLAMDKNSATCNKRFEALGIAQTIEVRREWRELIIATPGLPEKISAVILDDETLWQYRRDGTTFLTLLADAGIPADAYDVAGATLKTMLRVVPVAMPGIAFLSGGQSPTDETQRLNAINACFKACGKAPPWALAFSFARAIQQPALEIWRGWAANLHAAQQALAQRARLNRMARQWGYHMAMENA